MKLSFAKTFTFACAIGLLGLGYFFFGGFGIVAHSQTTFNYSLANSGNMIVQQGGSGSTTVTVTLTSGEAQGIALSLAGLPAEATANITNNPCNPTCSNNITIDTAPATNATTYPIVVTGMPLEKTTTFDLVVSPSRDICTPQDLANIRLNLSGDYIQMCDIDLSGVAWTPLGKDPATASATASPFKGTYNGAGKKIANLTINDSSSAALFASSEGIIENVTLQGANVKGQGDVGTLLAINLSNAIVQNASSTGTVEGSGNSNIGGLVGRNYGLVSDSNAEVAVRNTPPDQNIADLTSLGGLVGNNSGTIKDSYANGPVSGKDARIVGGLVGLNNVTSSGPALIDNCKASGAVTNANSISMGFAAGGLVGASSGSFDTPAEVKNSYATGHAQSASTSFVGGLIGVAQGSKISKSYATGITKGSVAAGGLIGMVESSGFPQTVIEDVDARGNVSAQNGYAGGLIGLFFSNASLKNAYSSGVVSLTTRTGYKGGLIGFRGSARDASVINSYWDTATSRIKTSAGGAGRTTAQMKTQQNYKGWDFTGVWSIKEGLGYPLLRRGFFLLSRGKYNGNLLGYARNGLGYVGSNPLEAADAICLNEVNTNGFFGKPVAKTYRQDEVYAFLCDSGSCQNLLPRKTYAMGRLGEAKRGGQLFTTDANGSGPGDNITWSNADAFDSNVPYWTSRFNIGTSTHWPTSPGGGGGAYCANWTSDNPDPGSSPGGYGVPRNVDAGRWSINVANCSTPQNLICVADSPGY